MTSGVSRSRSLPFSAMAGVAKTRTISAMQTVRTHSNESWKCIDMTYRQTVQPSSAQNSNCTQNSDRTRQENLRAMVRDNRQNLGFFGDWGIGTVREICGP